ncbi:MAG: hypothetical protein AAB244_04115, partial [Nitrospirota bacterium]
MDRRRFKLISLIGIAACFTFVIAGNAEMDKSPGKTTTMKMESSTSPIGSPRTDKDLSKDISNLLFDRRVSTSDMPGGVAFNPKECLRCHENEPGVEGQIFYGDPDYKKDLVWPKYIGDAEKKMAPSLKYNFMETHKKKSELVKNYKEQIMKQNQ